MPVSMIERRYAEDLEVSPEGAAEVHLLNDEEGVQWLYSFLSVDKRKTYCLYDAPSPEAVQRAALRAGLPADAIVDGAAGVSPDGSLQPV